MNLSSTHKLAYISFLNISMMTSVSSGDNRGDHTLLSWLVLPPQQGWTTQIAGTAQNAVGTVPLDSAKMFSNTF